MQKNTCEELRCQSRLGILFAIPSGLLLQYDTKTNRITPHSFITHNVCSKHEYASESLPPDVNQCIDLGVIKYDMSYNEYFASLEGGVRNLTLEMTQECNCRCQYCLYSGAYDNRRRHASLSMDHKTICESLKFYERYSEKSKDASISFYGGEALLVFDRIQYAIHEALNIFKDKTIKIHISSNGMLLSLHIAKWLSKYPFVSVVITMNGPYHDMYRKTIDGQPTLDKILKNLNLIREYFPVVWKKQINFIANISRLEQVHPLRKFYHEKIGKNPIAITGIVPYHGNDIIAEIVWKISSEQDRLWEELAEEYMTTGDPFLHALFRSRIFPIHKRRLFSDDCHAIAGNCLPFLSTCYISADGSFNLCEKNAAMSFGDIRSGLDYVKIKKLMVNTLKAMNQKCRRCWAQRLCSICFAEMDNPLDERLCSVPDSFCLNEKHNILLDLQTYAEFVLFHKKSFDALFASNQ